LLENVRSFDLDIDNPTMTALDRAFPRDAARGARYPDMARVNG
jgi:hypothetical protein